MGATTMEYKKKELPVGLKTTGIALLIVGFVLMMINFLTDSGHHERFWYMYNSMFMLLVSVSVGSLFIIALEHLVGAYWSVPFRRILECVVKYVVPATFVIGALQAFGFSHMFHWLHAPEYDKILLGKAPYLNAPFFWVRYVIYFVVWIFFSWKLNQLSQKQEQTGDSQITTNSMRWSALFMVLMALTLSFCAIDWIMSLEPHWFSTMFGVYYFAGTVMVGFCVLTLFAINLQQRGYLHPKTNKEQFYPMGTFMFAFNCFWTYIAFCQFMLIWYSGLPEETIFFIPRWEGSWKGISIALMILHFPIPFYGLISRGAKTNPARLKFFAVYLILMHCLDLFWLISGSLKNHETGVTVPPSFQVTDLGFLVFAVGVVITGFYFAARKVNLVAIKDPKLEHGLNWHP